MRYLRILLPGYAMLLAASTVSRTVNHTEPVPRPGESLVVVGAVEHDRITATPVRIAVFDSGPSGIVAPPTLVLLHGSPGDNGEVTRLARILAAKYRVVAPDLPGFGGSTRSVPDYSIRAHARYVGELLDSLRIGSVHLLGFSMGGGVALNLVDLAPARVASVTLLSAIGAQEFELLGDYHLNHALHGLQLGGLWAVENLIPHFGALDGGMLTLEYARNFYDSDQRPLRGIMARMEQPLLIIQGKHDPMVPAAIGPEHHRIVPQSELLLLDGDHFMAFQTPAILAVPIAGFIDRVVAGRGVTRSTASPSRLARAAEPLDPRTIPGAFGIGFVVLVLLIAVATLVTEDLTCIATGLLISRGTIGFLPGVAACLTGIVLGDLLLFAAGRYLGRPALRRRPLSWFLTDRDLGRTSAWFARRGPALVLTTRFIPGTRLPTYLAAGVLHTPVLPFLGWFVLAAAMWTPLLVGLAVLYGETVLAAFDAYRRWSLPLVILAGLALFLVVKLLVPLTSWRGRRLLLGRWKRLTRWEFWPPWLFYPPVVLYVLWLGLRRRSLTLFTAANPAIPGGGFVGESKWQILQGLAGSADRLPATQLLRRDSPPGAALGQVADFMARNRLAWPVVLKPDSGERGRGVAIVRSLDEAARYLTRERGDVLVQEFLPGSEYGVFYYRMPGEATGRVFSITDKRFPSVTGDGRSTLETLILRDPRAVALAKL
ncbi:MAG TPA: alpha/beta fold hydrolase, partial [Gemmatimonadales bacterium]